MVKLSDYDCIGFDLDHTIIQYRLGNLFELIYDSLTKFLVQEKGYDSSLLDGKLDDYKDFIMRGHVLDVDKGNLLKLDRNGFILRASHGTTPLSAQEISGYYGPRLKFPYFQELKDTLIVRARHISSFRTFENFFDIPGSLVAARLVDVIDKKQGKQDKYTFWPDVVAAFIHNFTPSSFGEKKGIYFPAITKTPKKYIKPCSNEMINWIKSLKSEKRKVFLLTNSYIDYASFLMGHAIGENWKDLFDIVICKASKPGFFIPCASGKPTPFNEIEGGKEVRVADELQLNRIYSQGNNELFMKHARIWTGNDNPKVLYFGDSAKSDIYPTYTLAKWDNASVLEEMETEGLVTLHHEDEESEDSEPKRKKAKLVEIDLEEGKDEVLLSKQWGSVFTDDTKLPDVEDIPDDGSTDDVEPEVNVPDVVHVANGKITSLFPDGVEFEEIDSKEVREMNTFWGDLIRRCSTIAIPTLDFITGLPIDKEFGIFDATHSGFYPGIPKSLHKEH